MFWYLQNKNTEIYILILNFQKQDIKKQKLVNYYDIQNILAVILDNQEIYVKYEIYLVIPDKIKKLEKVKNSNQVNI